MRAPDNGCKTCRQQVSLTASQQTPITITFSCLWAPARCARRRLPTAALACSRLNNLKRGVLVLCGIAVSAFANAAELPDRRFLIAHQFPFPFAPRPEFADENSSEARGRSLRKLHGGFIRKEGVIRPELLDLKELQQVVSVHAALHFEQYMRGRALA